MAKPTANFSFNQIGLTVEFLDNSTNGPTSWLWNFGDGTTSTSQNPIHVYSSEGYFVVSLTPTNADGAGTAYSQHIGVSSVGNALPTNIASIIDGIMPAGVIYDPIRKDLLIKKWQLHIQPLVEQEIDISKVYNEFAYPALVNYLIAQLVTYDIIIEGLNKYLLSVGQPAVNGTNPKELKKVVTGPSEAEWFSNSDVWGSIMKAGGAFTALLDNICDLSHRLRITLRICGDLDQNPMAPVIGYYHTHHHHSKYPFKHWFE